MCWVCDMARLGILACQIFERELAYLLSHHKEIDTVYMRRCEESRRVAGMMKRDVSFINDPELLSPISHGMEVLVEILPAGLHATVDDLEDSCNNAISSLKNVTTAILLFYGLCGNALQSVVAREDVHLVTIDDDGIIDDCIVGILGRERYSRELQRGGSFFFTNGWVTHWDSITSKVAGDRQGMTSMLASNNYVRAHYVSEKSIDTKKTLANAQSLSRDLNLDHELARGTTALLENALQRGIATAKTAKRTIKIKKG